MIKTILCFVYAAVSMIILTPIGFVMVILGFLGPRKFMPVLMYRVAQGWARVLIALIGCRLTVSGRENIPRSGGVCFVSNHGSIVDILLLLAYTGRPIGFIAKKELRLIPFLNIWISVLGGLFIDRKNIRKAIRTIGAGVNRIKSGSGMIIFPEGHRSRGQGLLPFHPGSLKLATQAEAPIVPVAIAGSYDVFERNYRANAAAQVKIIFGKPISTADLPPAGRKLILSGQIFGIIKETLEE